MTALIHSRPRLSTALAGLAALLLLAGSAAAQELAEGIDYRVVAAPARAESGQDVEVLELFWYGCPHCYQLEAHIERWLEAQAEGVTFRRLPAAASPRWVPHAKAYFAAEQLGVLDKLHEPLFRALHDQRRKVLTDDQIVAFAAEQGIDEDAFRAAYNSFQVDMQVRKSAELVRRYNIDGVPSIVVNGKYVTSATQTGSNAKMFAVIDALVAREGVAQEGVAQEGMAQEGGSGAEPAKAEQPAKTGDAG